MKQRRFIYILIILDYLIMELNGIILFDMNIFCFFRFSWSKLKDLYPALCKLLSKSKSVKLSMTQYSRQSVKISYELYGQVVECLHA